MVMQHPWQATLGPSDVRRRVDVEEGVGLAVETDRAKAPFLHPSMNCTMARVGEPCTEVVGESDGPEPGGIVQAAAGRGDCDIGAAAKRGRETANEIKRQERERRLAW